MLDCCWICLFRLRGRNKAKLFFRVEFKLDFFYFLKMVKSLSPFDSEFK